MESKDIMKKEKKYVMQTYSRLPLVISHGAGSYIFDKDGKKYLDLVGAIATNSVGYGNKFVSKAVGEQSKKLINATNLYYTEAQVLLAEKLHNTSGLDRAFFSNSGTEAVEAALKLARKYTKKKGIISTAHGFHGRTFGALSATGKESIKKPFEPLVPHFRQIPYNNPEALKHAITDNTAAFIVEPIQGEAGVIIPQDDYLIHIREICEQKDVLLIVDEIQTSLRTGSWFAFQHQKIMPDIITIAKGIANGVPLGATMAREEVANAFEKGDHGSTFGGNSLSCAAALATIDFIEKNDLITQAKKKGEHFLKQIRSIDSSLDKEARGKGLMAALELKENNALEITKKALSYGLIVNKVSDNTLRFLPPLTITEKEIDEGIGILEKVLQ